MRSDPKKNLLILKSPILSFLNLLVIMLNGCKLAKQGHQRPVILSILAGSLNPTILVMLHLEPEKNSFGMQIKLKQPIARKLIH